MLDKYISCDLVRNFQLTVHLYLGLYENCLRRLSMQIENEIIRKLHEKSFVQVNTYIIGILSDKVCVFWILNKYFVHKLESFKP